jgi:hypothetical protein
MFNAAAWLVCLGGFLIILFSEGICFASTLFHISVIFTLCLIRITYPAIKPERDSTLRKSWMAGVMFTAISNPLSPGQSFYLYPVWDELYYFDPNLCQGYTQRE